LERHFVVIYNVNSFLTAVWYLQWT